MVNRIAATGERHVMSASQSRPGFQGRRMLVGSVVLALGLASCGGSATVTSDSSSESPSPSETSDQPDDNGTTDTEPVVAGLGEATVTIDGETFYFGKTSFPSLRCDPDMFGVFWVVLGQVDESGNEVADGGILQVVVVREGTDPDEIGQVTEAMVDFPAMEETWIADPEEIELSALDPGTSQVDSVSVDDNHVSGTATAFERTSWFAYSAGTAENYLVTTMEFDATCGSGR